MSRWWLIERTTLPPFRLLMPYHCRHHQTPPAPKPNEPEFSFLTPMAEPPKPALPPLANPALFTSTPGLFFTPVDIPETPPPSSFNDDDDTEPMMFETLSIMPAPKEEKSPP